MATTYKSFMNNDTATTRTLLHEAIPITGSIPSGTYNHAQIDALGSEPNIKTYSHGMFQSVYDYPYLSSSANHIFDITCGYRSTSVLSGATNTQNAKKINIYNQFASVLVGHDVTGAIEPFKLPSGAQLKDCVFIPFSRLLTKDEIKKGSFTLELGVQKEFSQDTAIFTQRIKLTDTSGSNGYHVDSPTGDYGVLYASTSVGSTVLINGETLGNALTNPAVGLLYYQAGVAVISASVFHSSLSGGILHANADTSEIRDNCGEHAGFGMTTGSTISATADGVRSRIYDISYNNTTELNSTIYFCRINHNDFNYSANPTYVSASQIRIKTKPSDSPAAYFTTVGLYSVDNELLAVAKLSEPLRKDPTNELTLRVRLDY